MMNKKILIVGAGITGIILAERLASDGNKVTLIEKKPYIGGLCRDGYYKGVLVHFMGPHYFKTDSDKVFNYLSKFTKWVHKDYFVKTLVDGELYTLPININTINKFFKIKLANGDEAKSFMKLLTLGLVNCGDPINSETIVLNKVGRIIYEKFFKNYTKKQWGLWPSELDSDVCSRVPVTMEFDDRYFRQKYKGMPKKGYTKMFEKMIDNENISLILNADFSQIVKADRELFDKIIWTGKIDEYFNYKFGKLPYRSLDFQFVEFQKEFQMPCSQINHPNNYKFTRKTELKHATGQKCNNTVVCYEYPKEKGEPMYPIPTQKTQELYRKYLKESEKLDNVIFVGRLAEYKYYNMEQIVERCLDLFETLRRNKK